MSVTIVTRRTLIVPYTDAFESDFLMLNCCVKNRAQMNGPKTVASARQLFQRILHDEHLYAMAVLDNYNREYMGHMYIEIYDEYAELGFLFDKSYWGQGLASEALSAFFPNICQRLNLRQVMSIVNAEHASAIAILHKLGFQHQHTQEEMFGHFHQYQWLTPEQE
ncbi:GNAT family N-acetyltransferase [Vibrio sp. V27_P1S3P104]|nr:MULTISPECIES: GNAT family N-acetyltransferase [unclassified Vibrio]NAW68396.1 GNAT family N-acetyltransferase [Vibrio sp. V28_P6S34P95]NAX05502.1 GNAT family N-acetyltransferase [Vibrio sp. V30_P3S12P165]NAX33891.1 GNAT family N-acetyltransferase [Vibrio sp. V29_P1S30P107]NAX38207.1 GNAT family N-acetyltransferase [Vibrio sp. V27_P1S3P104]NAX40594.1 GNAT family N-acetyltransferase [Vibrio sp. V26_P1S5P106]